MKISYYDADDILHIELTGEPIETDESMAPYLHLGYSANGLAEITILDARQSDWEKLRDLLYYGAISCLGGYPEEDRSGALYARLKAHSLAQQVRDRQLQKDPGLAELLMKLPGLGGDGMEEQLLGQNEERPNPSNDVPAKSCLYNEDFYLWGRESKQRYWAQDSGPPSTSRICSKKSRPWDEIKSDICGLPLNGLFALCFCLSSR
jgi:hypothetical protein